MKPWIVFGLVLSVLAAAGCKRASDGDGDMAARHGRYSGVGLYSPGRPWTRLVEARQDADPQSARPIDDQVIIVVQDSATGEVRACGDLSGYCIGMNPWKTALAPTRIAPIKLIEHNTPDEPARP